MKIAVARVALLLCAATAPAQDYYPFAVDQDQLQGAPDFSSLNHPLGPEDRLFVRNGHFYRAGADRRPFTSDDERVRLFGMNLAFGGNFPEENDALRIAKRLRKLGVNLVRLHHMDSSPDQQPDNARSILTTGPYPTLNQVSVRRLRAFLDALRSQGIYVNLNLHVGYRFRPFIDGVPAMPSGADIPNQSKPLHIFYPRMVDKQVEYTEAVLRALRLKDDPVLGMVEINNESSMLSSWQGRQMRRYLVGAYQAELLSQWNAWLRRRYGSTEAICQAWQGCPEGETLERGGLSLVFSDEQTNTRRVNDFLLFLEDVDRNYLFRVLQAVRAETGPLVPVAGTQLNFGGPMNYDSHAPLDYQDNHFYIDHYNFPNRPWDSHDWRIRDSSSVATGLERFLTMAAYREAARPYTVSEYNQQYPNRQGAEIDPTLAAFAALQDWDSIMHFAYAHNRNWDKPVPSSFDINGDWTKYAVAGQSAWLFRSGVIQPAGVLVEIPLSRELKLRATREGRQRDFARFLAETTGFRPEVALRHRVAVVHEESRPIPWAAREPSPPPFRSDTGQLTYDPHHKLFQIHAPGAAGVFGYLGADRTVTSGDLQVRLAPTARGFAAILITSLDGNPLRSSARLLLSTPGHILGTQPGSNPPRPQQLVPYESQSGWWTLEKDPAFPDKPSGSRQAQEPVWMERVESFVTLRTDASRLTVYPLGGQGRRLTALPEDAVRPIPGGFELHLQAAGQQFSPWYELIAER